MSLACEFISGAANTVSGSIKWIDFQQTTYIVFGIHNNVAISEFTSAKIIKTLKAHQGKITAIDYLIQHDAIILFSGSEDSTIKVWRYQPDVSSTWPCVASLMGWKSSIAALTVCQDHHQKVFLFGSDSLGNVLMWSASQIQEASSNDFQLLECISSAPTQLPRAMKAAFYPHSNGTSDLLLFVGSVDSKIHIRCAWHDSNASISMKYMGSLYGHEEWITSLVVHIGSIYGPGRHSATVTLISGAQDSKIRIWKLFARPVMEESIKTVTETVNQYEDEEEEDLLDAQEDAVILGQEEILSEARLQFLSPSHHHWEVFLDALLVGHEDWVTSVSLIQDPANNTMRIYSTSMDRNMIIWSPDHSGASEQWMPMMRMGDIGGTLGGSVGQNLLGFVDGVTNHDGSCLLGIGFGGSFHLWRKSDDQEKSDRYMPCLYLTGHFASVNDFAWQGGYLVTVSSDQTCRLFAPQASSGKWKELSRPQIHGYDINCLAIDERYLISGSDEKVIRIFEAPGIVIEGLHRLCGILPNAPRSDLIQQAYLPELGLSNKAVEYMSPQDIKEQAARGVLPLDYSSAPLEGQLADHTIWPETRKLFGHRNEVISMDYHPQLMILASACKARDANDARIILWDLRRMVAYENLDGHESTVVRLRFSKDGSNLVSVGKDRSIVIHRRQGQGSTELSFSLGSFYIKKSAHKRIIWDACWLNTHTGNEHLLTVSRDGSGKIWQLVYEQGCIVDIICLNSFIPFQGTSITAADVHAVENLVLLGSEDGEIAVWRLAEDLKMCEAYLTIPSEYCHGAAIKRLAWQPSSESRRFGSCGEDHTLRVLTLSLPS
jgi:elongator complex protein 2